MRILKLHNPTGHPYWQANEYKVEKPNGEFVDIKSLFEQGNHGGYEIFIEDGDIYFVQCASGSGYGKQRWREPIKIVDKKEYDKIEYVGKELKISKELQQDMADNPFNKK